MSQTGLNEAQVRGIKKYRVMLAETQKPKGSSFGISRGCEKFFKGLVKSATKETKLATKHPKTLKRIEELLKGSGHMPRWFYSRHASCQFCNHFLAELKK